MCYTIIKKRQENKKENKTMNKQEIEKRIEELENRRFFLQMKDYWNFNDYRQDDELKEEIKNLKKMLDK